MAKKGGKSSGYISNGERPNVSRKIVLSMAADRRLNRSPFDTERSRSVRAEIIRQPRSAHDKVLADRYVEQDRVEFQAWKLIDQYREVGLERATAIQAVKTNYVEHLHTKWSPILKAHQEERKKK